MSTKRLNRHVLAMALIGGLFLGGAACDLSPPFFTASNADSPLLLGSTGLHPDGMGVIQKYMSPGLMNQGAIDPDGEFCIYADLWGNTPMSVFDGDSQIYRAINGDTAKAAAVALTHIEVRPRTKDATDFSARFIGVNSDTPALCIDMTDVTNNKTQAGTIFQFTISDVTDGGTAVWKVSDKTMQLPRIMYVREGTGNDAVSPEITDLSFAQGDTLAVDVVINVCFDEAMGSIHAGVVEPQPGSTPDIIVPVAVEGPRSDTHGYMYKFILTKDLEYGTQYYFVLLQEGDSVGNMSSFPPSIAFTQDFNGNAVDGDSTGIFSTGDLNEVLGGNTTHMIIKHAYFYTEAPPP